MKYALISTFIVLCSPAAKAADCIYYEHNDRTGASYELTAPGQVTEMPGTWNEAISSIWVRSGFYSIVTQDRRFQGPKVYTYGSGSAFSNNTWLFDRAKNTGDGGMLFDLVPFGFNDVTTSILCLKEWRP